MTAVALVLTAVLVVLNGGFVALEFGLIGAKRAAIDAAAKSGSRSAISAQRMQADVLTTLSGAQFGITLCSMAIGRLGEPAGAHLVETLIGGLVEIPTGVLHALGFGVALTVVAMIHMVVGEMIPKNLSLIGPERTLLVLARPMAAYLWLARPVVLVLLWASNVALKPFGVEPATEIRDTATVSELEVMLRESHEEGLIAEADREFTEQALRFGTTTVSEVMAPLADVAAVRTGDSLAFVEQHFAQTGRTRLVVFGTSPHDVKGMVHCIDLAAMSVSDDYDSKLTLAQAHERALGGSTGLIREILRLSPTAPLERVLTEMRQRRVQLAVVADVRGRTLGIVALDDILRKLIPVPETA